MKTQDEAAPPAESMPRSPHPDSMQPYLADVPDDCRASDSLRSNPRANQVLWSSGGEIKRLAGLSPRQPHPAWVRLIHHPGQPNWRWGEYGDQGVANLPDSFQKHNCQKRNCQKHSCQEHSFQEHSCQEHSFQEHSCQKHYCQEHSCQEHSFQEHSCQEHSFQEHSCQEHSFQEHSFQERCAEVATAKLSQDLGFYASVLDQLPYGVYCVDLHRTIIYWNAAAAAITGFQRYEVEGACCAQNILRHVNDAGQALCLNDCPLSATLQDGEVRRDRVYLHHRQGYRVPVWIQVVPWRDRQQNIIGAIETFVPEIPEMTPNGQLLSQLELDDLTQIGNRRFGRMHLEQLIQGLNQRSPWPPYDRGVGHYWHAGTDETRVELGGLLFLDIDHFKMINDRYGHGVGDQVLIMVARTISNTLRHGDYVARWGGEEFIVLLNQTDAVGMQDAAERIRRLVASSGLDHEDHFLQVTVSIGGTLLTPQDSVETALERADAQMYRSKQTGRNCTHIAELPPRPTSGS